MFFRASANRRVSYVSSDDMKAFPSRRGLSSAKSCQPIGGASNLGNQINLLGTLAKKFEGTPVEQAAQAELERLYGGG